MNHEIDLSKYKLRTDIILERVGSLDNSVDIKEENIEGVKITRVILDDINSKILDKKMGKYITIEFDDITDSTNCSRVTNIFTSELKKMMDDLSIDIDDSCLVIGLGNKKSTPDSLGPSVIDSIVVTKHLYDMKLDVESGFRNVAAISPGVMGVTGIETSDMISSLIDIVEPSFLIVIDSLASSSINRVNKTIQMTDTGIHPGSGIGNSRKEISFDQIGIPVIAIGVPTVVDAVTIVADTINYMGRHFSYKKSRIDKKSEKLIFNSTTNYLKKESVPLSSTDKKNLFGMLGDLSDDEIRKLIFEVLSPIGYNLMVTPKEVDFLVDRMSNIISKGINNCIHDKKTC